MGTIKQGILGGFNGKVGIVVGSSWKGEAYMRGIATHVKNPRTPAQIYQRKALQAVTTVLKPIAEALAITFGASAKNQSAFSKAVQINYKAAVENVDGEPVVNHRKLVLSKGFLRCFDMFFVDDPSYDGDWYVGAIQYDNSEVDFPGFILILYDKASDTWFTHVHDQPFTTGTSLTMQGFPIDENKDLIGWVFVYDKSLGQVSNKCMDFHSMRINEDDED